MISEERISKKRRRDKKKGIMSRFFAATYEYDSATSSSEEDLLSSSSEEELLSSAGEEESDDSFFAGESEEESESESELESDFSDGKPYGPDWFKKAEFRKGAPSGGSSANKFLKTSHYVSSSEEESDDEGKKVVKSARDKLLDEMREVYDKIETAEMTDDWITIQNEVDSINRMLMLGPCSRTLVSLTSLSRLSPRLKIWSVVSLNKSSQRRMSLGLSTLQSSVLER